MSLKVLYKLSASKKKTICQNIIKDENASEMFKFLIAYIDYKDSSCLKQVKQVIKIVKNCAEHAHLIQQDSINYLIKVGERALVDDMGYNEKLIELKHLY